MGIGLRVAGDEQSCRAAAQQLTSLAEGIIKGGTAFYTAQRVGVAVGRHGGRRVPGADAAGRSECR
jgi:hypothetical protein